MLGIDSRDQMGSQLGQNVVTQDFGCGLKLIVKRLGLGLGLGTGIEDWELGIGN